MTELTLYQFPISHYCEKTRWNLDAKGLSYDVVNLLPGAHVLKTRKMAGVRTVPVLADRGTVVGDSSAIALYLERVYPEPALLPADQANRARALDLEDLFDRRAGKSVRQWLYGCLMAEKHGKAAEVLFALYPPPVRLLGKVAAPFVERALRKMYRINREAVVAARATLLDLADRLENEVEGDPSRYLVGGSLSIADITAASLLSPLLTPPGSPYVELNRFMPASVRELQQAFAERPAGRWVAERYRRDRSKKSVLNGGESHA